MPSKLPPSSKRAVQEPKSHNPHHRPQSAATERAATEQERLSLNLAPVSGVGRRVTRSLAKANPSSVLPSTDTLRPGLESLNSETPGPPKENTRSSSGGRSRVEQTAGEGSLRHPKLGASDRAQSDPNQSIWNWAARIESVSPQDARSKPKGGNFWAQRGYEAPEPSTGSYSSAMADSSVVLSDSRRTSTRKAKSEKTEKTEKGRETVQVKDQKFSTVLLEHNINVLPAEQHDLREVDMKEILFRKLSEDVGFAVDETLTVLEARWRRDMSKCMVSNEALFQRTIMMEILERDELDEKLDFICETVWRADRMPGRDSTRKLAQPKPDLAVGFKTTSLLPAGATMASITRLGPLQGHLCAEGTSKGELDRAFHFFTMEVKGKRGQISNSEAEHQNLNTAAQGLYNIFVIMKEAGMENEFFKEVRFFSVVATTSGLEIRVHRALELQADDYIRPDCGIGFGFDEILKVGSGYDKKTATTFVFNILLHYGVKILHPVLHKAVGVVLKKRPGIAGLKLSPRRRSPAREKRSRDDDLSESFDSHTSQRRRMEQLAVA